MSIHVPMADHYHAAAVATCSMALPRKDPRGLLGMDIGKRISIDISIDIGIHKAIDFNRHT